MNGSYKVSPTKKLMMLAGLMVLMAPWMMGADGVCASLRARTGQVNYAKSAKKLFAQGEGQIKAGNFSVARKIFQRLKTKYPFSGFATLAEVSIANSYFKGGQYLQAVDAYKLFSKLHPSHRKTPYCIYQIAFSYYKLRPWNWFLVPSPHEKDASTTKQAIAAFKGFMARYPKHKKFAEAKKLLDNCTRELVKHEIYVARFYAKRGKYRSVVWRMEHVLKKYPDNSLADEARFKIVDAYLRLQDKKHAQIAFNTLLKKHPKSRYVVRARRKLKGWTKTAKAAPAPKLPSTTTVPTKKDIQKQ